MYRDSALTLSVYWTKKTKITFLLTLDRLETPIFPVTSTHPIKIVFPARKLKESRVKILQAETMVYL